MKPIIALAFIISCSIAANAQDTLILMDNTSIEVKILKTTENETFYFLWNDLNKNQRVISNKFIKEVKYQNSPVDSIEHTQEYQNKTDLIVCYNGDKMHVDIVDIGKENIIYREEGKNVNYIIPKDQVKMIKYFGGQEIAFNQDQKNNVTAEVQPEPSPSLSASINEPQPISGDIDKNRLVGFVFGGKLGYLMPFNDGIKEIYGAGFTYGLEMGYWGRNGFGWNLEWRDYAKSGQVTSSGDYTSTKVELMSLTTSFNYAFVEKGKFKTYAGIGLGAAFFTLSDQSSEDKYTLFEYYTYGGIYFKPIYTEIRFVNANWEKTNVGGFELCFGIVF